MPSIHPDEVTARYALFLDGVLTGDELCIDLRLTALRSLPDALSYVV
jgi:hypothetical protein